MDTGAIITPMIIKSGSLPAPGRLRPLAVTIVAAAAMLTAACSGSQPTPAPTASGLTSTAASASADAPSARQSAAEQVQTVVGAQIATDEAEYGEGTNSPCSTSSAQMFSKTCAQAVAATGKDATLALTQIQGRNGFATLTTVARNLQSAVHTYQQLGCATKTTSDTTRHACLVPAATIAQGFPDLQNGVTLGLSGK